MDDSPEMYNNPSLPNRPLSATVNKAVDWRGKVTPDPAKLK